MVHFLMSACGIGGLLKLPLIMALRPVLDFLETSKVGVWGRPASHKKESTLVDYKNKITL